MASQDTNSDQASNSITKLSACDGSLLGTFQAGDFPVPYVIHCIAIVAALAFTSRSGTARSSQTIHNGPVRTRSVFVYAMWLLAVAIL